MGNITNGTCAAVRASINDTLMANTESFYLDLQYYYARNIKQILTFDLAGDSGVTYTGGAYNTTYYKTGDASRGFTNSPGLQVLEASWISNNNLAAFHDGGASLPEDYICLVAYIDGAVPASLTIGFSTSQADYPTKKFETTISSGLTTGYSFINIAKSTFTKTGTGFDWDGLSYVKLQYTGGDGATDVYFDNLQLVRKDPGNLMPNPFQKETSTTWSAPMAVNSGKWFIGKENGVLICKNMNPQDATQALLGNQQDNRFQLTCELRCLTDKYLYGPVWYIDDSNYFKAYIDNDLLTMDYMAGGMPGKVTTAMSVVSNDVITFKVIKSGFSVFLVATRATEINNPYLLSAEIELANGYPGLCSKAGVNSQINSYAVTKIACSTYTGDGIDDYWKGQLSDRQCNVRFFGAKGDGSADDTMAIQNAINYLNGLGGGTLVFPKGKYKVTSQITLCGNLMIEGCNSTIYADPATFLQRFLYIPGFYPGVSKTLTSDGIIGSFSVNVGDTNNLSTGDYVIISDNSVNSSHVQEFLCIESVTSNSITFTSALSYNYTTTGSATVTKVIPTSNFGIRDLIVECSPTSDITYLVLFYNMMNTKLQNVQILNLRSITEPFSQTGINFYNGLNVEIDGCHITSRSGNGNGNGIYIQGTSNLIIRDNKLFGYKNGIFASRCEQVIISGNQVKGASSSSSGYGVYLLGCLHSIIDGNTVSGGYYTGITTSNSGRCTIKNNSIVGTVNTAFNLTYTFSDDTYECCHIVEGNIAEKNDCGIYINGMSKTIIKDNIFKDSTAQSIYISTGCPYSMIIGNTVVNSLTNGVLINSNDCVIDNNLVINTGNVPIWGTTYNLVISNNYIDGWGSNGGIRYYPGSVLVGNMFVNNDVTKYSLYCYLAPLPNDSTTLIGNISPTSPYEPGSLARLDAHSLNYGNTFWNVGQKTLHYDGTPTTGTFLVGDKVFYRTPTAGAYLGKICTTAGTMGTLNGGNTTGSITSGTNTLTVNSATGLVIGCYITINGVSGVKRVIGIDGTAVTIDSNANATVSNVAVAYSVATLKGFGMVQA